jgi:urease accessory protein
MDMKKSLFLALPLVAAASPVLAHPGHGGASLYAGLVHPFTGLDHMLAMTAVGVLAATKGGAAKWAWPCAFVGAMVAGYGLGVGFPGADVVEPAVLASVIVLGALIASAVNTPFALGLGLIAAFGLCHGYAHGSEAPNHAGLTFPIGFVVSTAVLHGLGLGVGALALRLRRPWVLRALGGGAMLGGVALALAVSGA